MALRKPLISLVFEASWSFVLNSSDLNILATSGIILKIFSLSFIVPSFNLFSKTLDLDLKNEPENYLLMINGLRPYIELLDNEYNVPDEEHVKNHDGVWIDKNEVRKLFKNPRLREEMGCNAQKYVMNNHDIRSQAKRLASIYYAMV